MTRIELADAMLKGLSNPEVRESAFHYIGVTGEFDYFGNPIILPNKALCCACAIGCALIGAHDGDYRKASQEFVAKANDENYEWRDELEIYSDLLGISFELARQIERQHLDDKSVAQIADWLKSDPDWAEGWEDAAHV